MHYVALVDDVVLQQRLTNPATAVLRRPVGVYRVEAKIGVVRAFSDLYLLNSSVRRKGAWVLVLPLEYSQSCLGIQQLTTVGVTCF